MKKQLLIGLLSAAGGLGLTSSLVSCDDYRPTTDMDGKLLVSVDLDSDVVTSTQNKQTAPLSRAEAQSVSASNLSLKLTSEYASFSREWATAAEFSDPVSIPVGKYTLEAYYGALENEGFECPYYYGSSSLTIEENKTTPVSVTASLANTMVRVEMSDMFRNYFTAYSLTLRSELGNEIAYPDGETRSVYLSPGLITASITITKKNGTTATLQPKSFTAEARHSYVLKFDINGSEAGDGSIVLTYDEMTNLEDVEIDLSDAILNAPIPRLNAEGFNNGDHWSIMPGEVSDQKIQVTAIAQGGISGITLTTTSAYLQSLGWPTEIDLVSGDQSKIALMQGLGLKLVGTNRPYKMALIDFTNLLPNIQYTEDAENSTSFTIQVIDRNSRVAEQAISFSVEAVTTSLEVVELNNIYQWATTLEFDIETNASSLNDIKLQVKNPRNTWDNCAITSCEAVSGAENKYHVVATVPSSDQDLQMRLSLGTVITNFTVTHATSPYSLEAVENGVYGWQAALDLKYNASTRSAEEPEIVTFEISADNGKTWGAATSTKLASNRYLIKGLTGGTSYKVRATCDGNLSTIYTFTTETGAQLANSDMETWSRTDGQTKYWWTEYAGASKDAAIWGTMNILTTSEGGTDRSWFGDHSGTAYAAFSGTRQETGSVHTGSSAAIIETIGWGKENDANGSSKPKKITVGELYLGSYNEDTKSPTYGYSYTNRPASLEFWYKYSKNNDADYGYASIKVLDNGGNILAEKDMQLAAVAEYTKATIGLTDLYEVPCAQAASIQVVFKSSGNPEAATNNTKDWLSYPPAMNLSDGRFTGSSLYIDDIKLNY